MSKSKTKALQVQKHGAIVCCLWPTLKMEKHIAPHVRKSHYSFNKIVSFLICWLDVFCSLDCLEFLPNTTTDPRSRCLRLPAQKRVQAACTCSAFLERLVLTMLHTTFEPRRAPPAIGGSVPEHTQPVNLEYLLQCCWLRLLNR